MFKILEYLKKNTDREHPVRQSDMRNDPEISEYLGDKETYTRRSMRIHGLYYNRTFSYEEINSLIEGVLASKTLDTRSANALIKKIEENLTTKFYKKEPKQIFKIQEPQLADRELLRENLLVIQKAIEHHVCVCFYFNGYTYQKKLEHVRKEKYEIDPSGRIRPDYNFLHDWFGDNFRYIRTEKEAPYDDIVHVECSPFGMVNWAFQYSDRVEVLAPESVQERVIEKIRNLKEMYGDVHDK